MCTANKQAIMRKKRFKMESKDSSGKTVAKTVIGIALSPIAVLSMVPAALWMAYWGAKISLALTVAFGWHQFGVAQVACVLLASRLFTAHYDESEVKKPSALIVWCVSIPVLLYLTVLAILWIAV